MTELLERDDELAALSQAIDAAARGEGSVVLIGGEAGIGKSSLVTELVRREGGRTRILVGGCDALFTPRPLGPLHDVARATGGRLLAALGGSGGRDAVFDAALDELRRPGRPTALVIEDAHWADEATLDFLKFVGRRMAQLPALLVVTFRDDELGAAHPLRLVIGELPAALVRRVRPRPLSPAAVRALARRAGRSAGGLHDATGGNPFFVTEVLAADARDASIPVTVRDAVLARIARLDDEARAVMELAAVVPARTERWLLDAAVDPTASAIERALAAGLVWHPEGGVAFRHELARRAVHDALSPDRRRALHARCLDALRSRGEGIAVARLVHHADGAGDVASVLQFGPLAAEQAAAVGAHREAASHLERVLRHADALPPLERAELLERRSYECYLTGRMADAAEARHRALVLWREAGRPERVGDAERWLSRLSWFLGDRAAAERHGAAAVAVLEALPAGRELAMAYSNMSQLAMLAYDAAEAQAWGTRAIAIAEALGDVDTLTHALNNVGTAVLGDGDAAGLAPIERSLALSLSNGFHEHAARAYTNLGSTYVALRAYPEARRWLDEGIAYTTERDLDAWTLYMRSWRARLCFDTGDWTAAADDAEAVSTHPGAAPVSRISAFAVLGRVRSHRDDPGWEALLDEARRLAAESAEVQRILPVACARAEAAWLRGDDARAGEEAAWAIASVSAHPSPDRVGELGVWLRRAGRAWDSPPVAGALSDGWAIELSGDAAGAAAAWTSIGAVTDAALALAATHDEGSLRRALAEFEQLGSVAGATLVRRRLHALGARQVPRGERATTRSNPARLTLRQSEILGLLCDGLRNAQIADQLFLSEKTVDHHVSAILAKLGARTRTEAAARARQLGIR